MFTVDMNRCPACPDNEVCTNRKKIVQALSTLTHELNTDETLVAGPGDGIIIVHCQYGLNRSRQQ